MYIIGKYACLHGYIDKFACRLQYTSEYTCIYKKSTFNTEIEEYRLKEYTHTLKFFCLILNQYEELYIVMSYDSWLQTVLLL
jgi:hypothetical protein